MNFKKHILLFPIIFFLNCGIVDLDSPTGALQVVFSENDNYKILNKSDGMLESVFCVVKKGSDVVFSRTVTRIENRFIIEIDNLNSGSNYSVILYGQSGVSNIAETSASRMNISISKSKVTVVELDWSSFVPALLFPLDDEIIDENHPMLKWSHVAGAVEYWFRIEDHPFQPGPSDIYVTKDTCYVLSDSLANGTYYWNVRSLGYAGIFSQWTEPNSFRINMTDTNNACVYD